MTRRTDGPFIVYEILPGQLFQRGKLHGLSQQVKKAGLAYYGITYSIALAPTTVDLDLENHYHSSMPDGVLRDPEGMLGLARTAARGIEDGEVVLTMCNAGRNRSGLLSALIVRELTGLPGAAAMAVVRQHRPNAIANPHFERFLEGLS